MSLQDWQGCVILTLLNVGDKNVHYVTNKLQQLSKSKLSFSLAFSFTSIINLDYSAPQTDFYDLYSELLSSVDDVLTIIPYMTAVQTSLVVLIRFFHRLEFQCNQQTEIFKANSHTHAGKWITILIKILERSLTLSGPNYDSNYGKKILPPPAGYGPGKISDKNSQKFCLDKNII